VKFFEGHRARLPLAILGVGCLLVALIWVTRPRVEVLPPDVVVPLIRALRVEPQSVTFVVRAHGTVVPRNESDLVPQVSGEVIWVSPALVPGGFFAAGDPLVRIDPVDYEVDVESARAALARAESEHARARKERERQRRLADRSIASESRIDDAVNALHVAEAGEREARARLARAERDLDRTELRAPYDGRVRRESVDLGQFVTRGSEIAKLYAVDYAEVRLPVPDRQLAFLDLSLAPRLDEEPLIGPLVELRAEFAGVEHTWTGRIVRTEGEIDPKSRMVNVVARVEDPYGRDDSAETTPLAVGLFVDAEIQGRRVEDAFVLPRAALRDEDRVLIVDDEARLRFRPVQVLRARRGEVVIGDGLEPGERVCISPLQAVVDGMRVRIFEEPAEIAEVAP
jgi:RND family efflux transporter MFP subunit